MQESKKQASQKIGGVEAEKGRNREGTAHIAGPFRAIGHLTSLVGGCASAKRICGPLCGLCYGRALWRGSACAQR